MGGFSVLWWSLAPEPKKSFEGCHFQFGPRPSKGTLREGEMSGGGGGLGCKGEKGGGLLHDKFVKTWATVKFIPLKPRQ